MSCRDAVCGILDRMTAETAFEPMATELLACGIDSEGRVNAVLELLFSRVLTAGPAVSPLYAKICGRISGLKIDGVDFDSLLLAKCDRHFTKLAKRVTGGLDANEVKREATLTAEWTPRDVLSLHMNRRKRRLMGHVGLIINLWLNGVLTR